MAEKVKPPSALQHTVSAAPISTLFTVSVLPIAQLPAKAPGKALGDGPQTSAWPIHSAAATGGPNHHMGGFSVSPLLSLSSPDFT